MRVWDGPVALEGGPGHRLEPGPAVVRARPGGPARAGWLGGRPRRRAPSPARGQRRDLGVLCHVRRRPHGHHRGAHDRARAAPAHGAARQRHLPDGLRRGVELHVVVLAPPPLRPGPAATLRPPLGPGVGGLSGIQRAVRGGGRRRRRGRGHGPHPGLPPQPPPRGARREAPRPPHRPLHPHPLRQPRHPARPARGGGPRGPRGHGACHRVRLPHGALGGELPELLCGHGRRRGPHLRVAAHPGLRVPRRTGRLGGVPGRGRATRGAPRRTAHGVARRPDRARQEPAARLLGVRRDVADATRSTG